MHSNWVKIRIFEQPLLRKLSAEIEGQPGKRGRDEEGEGSPDKKVAKPEEPAAATADIGLATFRGSEVLLKLHQFLRLPSRTRLWGFYIYHIVMNDTNLPTDFRDAPAAAVADRQSTRMNSSH